MTYLDKIVSHHKTRALEDERDLDQLIEAALRLPRPRGFAKAIARSSREDDCLAVIAEFKKRSPSKGPLVVQDFDLAAQITAYDEAGAVGMSVLTDQEFFGGSLDDLSAARQATDRPLLRKDFVVDERDVVDVLLHGGDMVLLIAAALGRTELVRFSALAHELALDVLVEVHDDAELDVAMAADPDVIGINQRDLATFEVDTARASRVRASVPSGLMTIAESGVGAIEDAHALRDCGFDAVLVGEFLMTRDDPRQAIRQMTVRNRLL